MIICFYACLFHSSVNNDSAHLWRHRVGASCSVWLTNQTLAFEHEECGWCVGLSLRTFLGCLSRVTCKRGSRPSLPGLRGRGKRGRETTENHIQPPPWKTSPLLGGRTVTVNVKVSAFHSKDNLVSIVLRQRIITLDCICTLRDSIAKSVSFIQSCRKVFQWSKIWMWCEHACMIIRKVRSKRW